ncbi:unnamed protein product [Ceratitis capitata]|nr:unnamed protein product [Ceratitis capitata]
MKSKGYAFVSFVKKAEAENAIQAMNGQWIGSRSIRTNWSTRKLPPPRESTKSGSGMGMKGNIRHTFEEVYNQSSPTNTTVYCGGFPPNVISDEVMHKHFIQFGPIQDVRVFKDKGYAFIKFVTKESAARAIEHTHNSEVHGNQVKCFWGKENGGDNSMNNVVAASAGVAAAAAAAAAAAGTIMSPGLPTTPQQAAAAAVVANAAAAGAGLPAQMMTQQQLAAQYPYAAAYQQMGYWYPPTGYPAAQMQTQYMQQGYYPYAYASAQQAGAAGYRMVQPNVTWGVPGAVVPGVTAAAATAAAAANGSLGPQMMYSAAMPQYQGQ